MPCALKDIWRSLLHRSTQKSCINKCPKAIYVSLELQSLKLTVNTSNNLTTCSWVIFFMICISDWRCCFNFWFPLAQINVILRNELPCKPNYINHFDSNRFFCWNVVAFVHICKRTFTQKAFLSSLTNIISNGEPIHEFHFAVRIYTTYLHNVKSAQLNVQEML